MDDKVLKAINTLDKKLDKKFEEGIKEINKNLDEQFEKKFISLFNQGFEDIVRPEIEYLRVDMEKRFDRIERVLDKLTAKQIDQESELKDHDKRLKKVEISATAA